MLGEDSSRPLLELLRDVKLRPVFQSLPSPRDGHSPSLPVFQAPHFSNYGSFEDEGDETKDLASPACFGIRENRRMSLPWAVFNIVNSNLSVGCIYLPYAISQFGLIPSYLVLLGITWLNGYTSYLTGYCKRKSLASTYPEMIEYYYHSLGRIAFYSIFHTQVFLEMMLYQRLVLFCFRQLFIHSFLRNSAIVILPMIVNSSTLHAYVVQSMNILSTVFMILFYLLFLGICVIAIWHKQPLITWNECKWTGIIHCFGMGCFIYRNCQLCVPTLLNSMDTPSFQNSIVFSLPITYIIYILTSGKYTFSNGYKELTMRMKSLEYLQHENSMKIFYMGYIITRRLPKKLFLLYFSHAV